MGKPVGELTNCTPAGASYKLQPTALVQRAIRSPVDDGVWHGKGGAFVVIRSAHNGSRGRRQYCEYSQFATHRLANGSVIFYNEGTTVLLR